MGRYRRARRAGGSRKGWIAIGNARFLRQEAGVVMQVSGGRAAAQPAWITPQARRSPALPVGWVA